ncbi:DHA2 family efflux MFS transporter permease subunit [Micromonospora echinaurantiaca]|uniref:DHA2 family efflux MFS transporter permease subunit n=1 Tax=Micromonospora echinaurantiaca TaxID=47857 RepID=UPI00379643A0
MQGTRRWWAVAAMMLAMLTVGFDVTILNVALPTLGAELGASTSQLQWIVDAYVVVFAALLLPAGALADRYGRRLFIVAGLLLFGAASALASLTTDPAQLVAARAIMGVGGAILTPVTLATLPVLFPEAADRRKAIASLTAAAGAGVPLGPLVGGYLLDNYWWGSVFLVNVPVAALALVAVAVLIPESRDPARNPVDVPGAILSTLGLVALVYGIIEGPVRGWGDPAVLVALAGGAVLLATLLGWQLRARYPMVDLALFRSRRFLLGSVVATLAAFALFGLLFVLPQYLQVVRGHDAFGTGLRLVPMMAGMIVAAKVAEWLVGVLGSKIPVLAGLVVAAAGLGWGAATDLGTAYGVVAGWLAVIGFGTGLALTGAVDAVLGALPPAKAGAGTGLSQALRQVGGAVGVAVLGSVLADTYAGGLPAGAPEAARDSVAGAAALAARVGDPALLVAARNAYLDAMSAVLLVCVGVALAGAALAAAFLPNHAPAAPGEEESAHEFTRAA